MKLFIVATLNTQFVAIADDFLKIKFIKWRTRQAAEEDEDEFSFEGFDEYLDGFDEDSFDESDEEEKMLVVDPDFASCGTKWLDKDDSCHRSIQIASQRAKCRREEAHTMLLKTPSDARSRKTVASAFERTCRQAESVQVELQKYEDEVVVSDLSYVRSRSVLVEEIESLDRLIHWLEIDQNN